MTGARCCIFYVRHWRLLNVKPDKTKENEMKAFVAALIGLVVITGVAWGGLHLVDFSTKTVNQSDTGAVRLE